MKFLIKLFIKNADDVNNPKVRSAYGVLAGVTTIVLNVLMFIGKFIAGLLSFSATIMADAFNNLTDAGSSVVTLIGFKMAGKPNDSEHPFGHGRMEYLSGLIVSMLIMVVGVELVINSVEKIITGSFTVNFTVLSYVVLAVAILVKLWMCFFNYYLAKKIDSEALKATTLDSKSDVVATTTVLLSAVITQITGWTFIDSYMGVAVGLFIIYGGLKSTKEMVDVLLGTPPDKEFSKKIIKFVEAYDGVIGAHDLVVHNYGPGRQMISVHAEIPNTMDINVAHELIDKIEVDMHKEFNCGIVIHMDPIVVGDPIIDQVKDQVKKIVKNIHPEFSIHDFAMTKGELRSNLIFDLVRNDKCKMTDKEIIDVLRKEIKKLNEGYEIVVTVERSYC